MSDMAPIPPPEEPPLPPTTPWPDTWNRSPQDLAAAQATFVEPEPVGDPVPIAGLMAGHALLGLLIGAFFFLTYLHLYRRADQLLKQTRQWEKIELTAADRLAAASRAEAELPVAPGWDEKDQRP